jgi:hypothetical protein
MSLQVELCFINGETKELTISPNENIGEKKKAENQGDATWKSSGKVLKDNKTFGEYNIEKGDIIYSSTRNLGGTN